MASPTAADLTAIATEQPEAVSLVRAFIVEEVGEDMGPGLTGQAQELVWRLAQAGLLAVPASRMGEGVRSREHDGAARALAAQYRDPDAARFAINDYRDWLVGDGLSTTARSALAKAGLPLAAS